jgi:hypothetical protein
MSNQWAAIRLSGRYEGQSVKQLAELDHVFFVDRS